MKNRYNVRIWLWAVTACKLYLVQYSRLRRIYLLIYVDEKFVLCAKRSRSVAVGEQTSLLLYPKWVEMYSFNPFACNWTFCMMQVYICIEMQHMRTLARLDALMLTRGLPMRCLHGGKNYERWSKHTHTAMGHWINSRQTSCRIEIGWCLTRILKGISFSKFILGYQ